MEGSGSVQIITDPDPKGPKTYGSGTLSESKNDMVTKWYHILFIELKVFRYTLKSRPLVVRNASSHWLATSLLDYAWLKREYLRCCVTHAKCLSRKAHEDVCASLRVNVYVWEQLFCVNFFIGPDP
jgi:hypothetical protein